MGQFKVNALVKVFGHCRQVVKGRRCIPEAHAVIERFGNACMVRQVLFHFFSEGTGIDTKGIEFYRRPLQLVGQEIMFLRCQRFLAAGQVHFKIQVPGCVVQVIFVHVLQEHDGLAELQHHPVQRLFFKPDFHIAYLELRVQIRFVNGLFKVLVQFPKAFFRFFHAQFFHGTVYLVAAVHADAAVPVQQCLDDFFFRFQPRCVGRPAAFIAGGQNAPGGSVHHLKEVALQQVALFRCKVNQHRFDLFVHKQIRQLTVHHTQKIAESYTDSAYPAGGRSRPANQAPYQRRVVGIQREHADFNLFMLVRRFELFAFPGFVPFRFFTADHRQMTAAVVVYQT